MWLNIPDEQVPVVINALRASKGDRPASEAEEAIAAELAKDAEHRANQDNRYRDAVETDTELEVDADAVVSEGGDPGAWVMAWVWVTDEEAGIEEGEEEDEDGGQP